MTKYSLVVYRDDYRAFLEKLQGLGVVDITVSAFEPDELQRGLMGEIEDYRQAVSRLDELEKADAKSEKASKGKAKKAAHKAAARTYPTLEAAYEAYSRANGKLEELTGELSRVTKEIEELKPWGAFDARRIEELRAGGIDLHFYSLFIKEYEAGREAWDEKYAVQEIARDTLRSYFIIAAPADEPLEVDAQELKPPTADYHKKEDEARKIIGQMAEQEEIVASLIPYKDDFEAELDRLKSRLQLEQVSVSGQREAEDTLVLLEGWAPTADDAAVQATLDETGALYLQGRPTPEDEVPVLLKNGKFSSLFEVIGNFYSLPKYGTMDLTKWFGPFYMLFFGLCLADAGYGLIYLIAGLVLRNKVKPAMKGLMSLVALLGLSTMICGTFLGSFFGIKFTEVWPAFAGFQKYVLSNDGFMFFALGLGIFQILFAMSLKVVSYTKQYGIRYALSTIGWMIVIISSLIYIVPGMIGMKAIIPLPVYYVCLGVGAFMMLFLNSPGKNPFVNFGSGLWNTYNDVTGLLSDVLSYIRLFAIGLAGGSLAFAFNMLAEGLSPNIPVVKQLVMLIILLIGHGLNFFMSSLSSMVHPMRLTFVEFYKNAGFEAAQREFKPLKRAKK